MNHFCNKCGAQLDSGVKFCSSCGTAIPPGTKAKNSISPQGFVARAGRKNRLNWKLILPAIAAILLLMIGVILLPVLEDQEKITTDTIGTAETPDDFSFSEADYGASTKKLTVTPEKPQADAYGVTISFGEYGLDNTETLKITRLPEKVDEFGEVKVTAYDFDLGGRTDFEDVIVITIPYEEAYVEKGAETECIGAKYYNQETGEWEGVYYEVDTQNRQVIIYTTHLSTYGVFQVKNENTRKAYVTDVYAIASLLNSGKAYEVLNEFSDLGQPGSAAFEAGFEAVNSVVGNAGTAVTAITLGGQYEGALADVLGKGTQHLGLTLSAVQTCYDFTYNFSDDAGKLSTLSNLAKNIANNAVGYFGSAALQVGFAGVAVFDVLLSTVQSDMVELKLENIGDVYQYYNDVEAPRTNKEWRRLFIRIMKDNQNDPDQARLQIEAEIDQFCGRFWELDFGKVKEIAGVSGKKYSFDERGWTKDQEVLTRQYKAYLMNRLQAPLTSARNYLLNQAMELAQKEFEKQLNALKQELNKTVKVQIIEEPEKAGDYLYGGYTLRFAPLSGSTDPKGWTGKLSDQGTLNTSFTILGHMQSGSPNRVELFAPGEDTPTLTVPFKVSYPTTTILLKSTGEKELLPTAPPDEADTDLPADTAEFAWVLVDTVNYDGKDYVNETNSGGIYEVSASSAPGSYSYTWKYLGDTDTYYDPPILNGENSTSTCTFSVPPSIIQGGETVTLSMNLAFGSQNLSYYTDKAAASADFDEWNTEPGYSSGASTSFTNKEGKDYFSIDTYETVQVYSVSETLTASAPSGQKEGDKIALRTLFHGAKQGTSYIYEWKPIS